MNDNDIFRQYVCTFNRPDGYNGKRINVDAWLYRERNVCWVIGYYGPQYHDGRSSYTVGEMGGYNFPFTIVDAMNVVIDQNPHCQIVDHYRGPNV